MKQFIKIDYYIQIFLACILNPIGLFTLYGMMFTFPIIGLYQLISDVLHLFVFKTAFLRKERSIHFYGAIAYLIVVSFCTYSAFKLHLESGGLLFVISWIIIPEIMVWVRFSWARNTYLQEKKQTNINLVNELQQL